MPALFALPFLATLLGGLFIAVFKFFGSYLTRRFAIVFTVLVVVGSFVAAFFVAFVGIIEGISASVPSGMSQGMSLVVPDNVPLLLSTLATARLMRWAYEWNVKVVQWRLF